MIPDYATAAATHQFRAGSGRLMQPAAAGTDRIGGMRFPIAARLFLAALLAAASVAAIELALVRWALFDRGSPEPLPEQSQAIDALMDSLRSHYRQSGGWQFLPADEALRKVWLRDQFGQLAGRPGLVTRADDPPSLPGYRIGLLDGEGHLLSGVSASRLLIAFAQIDTHRRAIRVDDKTVGSLVEALPRNGSEALAIVFLIDQQRNLLAAALCAVLLSALAAAALAGHFRRPIRVLVQGSQHLQEGRFNTRLDLRRSDELGELATTFNQLAATLESAEQSRRQWVADTSHELRTPLSVLRGQLEALQDGVRSPTPDHFAVMMRQTQALSRLVDELYQLARGDVGQLDYQKADCDLWPLLQDVLRGFEEKFRAASLTVGVGERPPRSMVYCDEARLRQVLVNLLENSVRYTAAGGRIEVRADNVGDELRVTVADSAPGVPEAMLARLGQRFFRVDGSRSRQSGGAGLGLALCRQIIEAHEGRLEFAASALGGLSAALVLKLQAAP